MSKFKKNQKRIKYRNSQQKNRDWEKKAFCLGNESQKETDNINQRRNSRLTAIIALIAIAVTICTFLYNVLMNSMNVWNNTKFYLVQIVLLALSSFSIIIFIQLIEFIFSDLRRFDILDKNYPKYDGISDTKYQDLVSNFKVLLVYIITLVYFLLIYLNVYYSIGLDHTIFNVILYLSGFIAIVLIVVFIWKKQKLISRYFLLLIAWIIVGFVCFIVGFMKVLPSHAEIEVRFNENGVVEILSESSSNFTGLKITIYNTNSSLIYSENIDETKLLRAKENTYLFDDNKQEEEGILINGELLYWKYDSKINELIKKPGDYIITIVVKNDTKYVELINSFKLIDDTFIYTREIMTKVY